ncbi:MAG: DUF58 domain-containing protein [Rhizobiaceae bacterium]
MTTIHMESTSEDLRVHTDAKRLRSLGNEARKVSLLPSRQPANSVLNGRHASRLRGRGLNFEELRDYINGDDVRTIDWKVTARTGKPHVRVYTEERDRPALLLVDQRTSMFFGSQVYMKSVIAAEAAAIAAHRILDQGDRIGGIVFGDDRIAEHRPVRSRTALRKLLTSIADANSLLNAEREQETEISINTVLKSALRIAKTNGLVLVFSDFDTIDSDTERLVRSLSASNDLIFFNVADPFSEQLPSDLKLTVSDGVLQAELDLADTNVKRRLEEVSSGRLADIFKWSAKYGFPVFPLTTTEPALIQILRLLGHLGARH